MIDGRSLLFAALHDVRRALLDLLTCLTTSLQRGLEHLLAEVAR